MPYSLSPAGLARASNSVTAWPSIASLWAQARPCRPRPPPRGGRSARPAVGFSAGRQQRVGCVALQQPDPDRRAFGRLAHAGLLAKRLGRADARAHAAHDIGVEDGLGCGERIAGRIWRMNSGISIHARAGGNARRLQQNRQRSAADTRLMGVGGCRSAKLAS